jgi:prepilin-type N-terminal cleavage/methylation domain-containing protein
LSDERGYTLVEMLVVMAILGVVIAGLTTVFVSGSRAELDMNRRFQAQQQARLALDRIRADLHCATAAQVQTINGYTGGVAISAPNCSTATIDWCLVPSAKMTGRYALYRTTSTTNKCASADTGRLLVADYLLTNSNVFSTLTNVSNASLEVVSVDFPISVNPTTGRDVYELKDMIVARNSARCGTSGGCPSNASPYTVTP